MNSTTTMVARKLQAANTTKATRTKSERLEVITLTRFCAYVEGDHDDYAVDLQTLRCTCPAGQVGKRCSHAMAAVREQARRQGLTWVMFGHSLKHAESFAAMQRAKGKTARVEERGAYVICLYGSPASLPVAPRAPRPMADVQAAADSLFL